MSDRPTGISIGRRNFIVRAILAIQATVGATLAFILGATTLTPSFLQRQDTWLRAADLDAASPSLPDCAVARPSHTAGLLLG